MLSIAVHVSNQLKEWRSATHATQSYPVKEMELLRQEGFFTVTMPGEALSVEGNFTAELLQLLKLIGKGNLSVGRIYEGHINALLLIHLYGSEEQKRRYYNDARDGHLFGVWNTEMHDGVHIHETEEGCFHLMGCKSFCSGSTYVTRPIVPGVLHPVSGTATGWQMTIVPMDEWTLTVDKSFWKPMGMQNSVSHKIDFTDVLLRQPDLLGTPDQYELQPYFSGGAIRFAAVHLGAAEALLDETRRFLQKVNRTNDPHQRTRVGKMSILVETGNLWLQQAGQHNDLTLSTEVIVNYANMTRTVIAELCSECLQLAERCVGARGLLDPEPFSQLHTDLSMYLRQPAPDATLEAVGHHYLQRHDDSFHHLRTQ